MNGPLDWIAALGTMLAAGLIAADLGRKATGWGFVLFVGVAATWVFTALTSHPPSYPVAVMNGILMLINVWGVWQYMLNPRKKREIDLTEQCAEEAREELEEADD